MAFRLADLKKTARTRADGERYLHPKLLDGPAVTAQVSLALSYFQGRLGRTRREVDPETLVRFFGDPKVARGLVACLSATYRWRTQEFGEVLQPRQLARLVARGVQTPCDLRLYLYDRLNRHGSGFLPAEREASLQPLAAYFRLAPAKLDQLVALDAEENAVLVRVGAIPEPEMVVALFNFHAIDTVVRNSAWIDLTDVTRSGRAVLEEAARLYGIKFTEEAGGALRLHNQADLFGSFARHGARLARALYTASALVPALLTSGRVRVPLAGKPALYQLERESLRALTARTGAIRCAAPWAELRELWDRFRTTGGVAGWRLSALPEPVLSPVGLAIAPFAVRRDEQQVLLWPVKERAALDDARALRAAGLDILPVLWPDSDAMASDDIPFARAADGAAGVVAVLSAHWSGGRVSAAAQALDGLLDEVAQRGFVPEAEALMALGCASHDELAGRLRGLDPARAAYVPGTGLCSPAFAAEMRRGLRRRTRAA